MKKNKVIAIIAMLFSMLSSIFIVVSMNVARTDFENNFVHKMGNIRNLVFVATQRSEYNQIEELLRDADMQFGEALGILQLSDLSSYSENADAAHYFLNLSNSRDLLREAIKYCTENNSNAKIDHNLEKIMEQICRSKYDEDTFETNDDTDVYYPKFIYLYQHWEQWLVLGLLDIGAFIIFIFKKID